ncbi:hypothetical protein SL057_002405 [Flavobacterium psychrophilum]|nr:hypothetical protein [Flavobacterium psychrophilum]
MTVSTYYLRARLFPTILTIFPIIIFVYSILSKLYENKLTEIANILPIVINLGLSTALVFLMVQINRIVSKEIFQKYNFVDELKMPTTNHLLWSNDYFEKNIKEKLHLKILNKFDLPLFSESEEQVNELKSRKQIALAVSQIRNILRENKLLLQHNIEYGFFRNLIGGSLIALIFSIIIVIYSFIINDSNLKSIGITLSIIYFIPILLNKPIINRFGNYYSKILYEQFLTIQ